MVKVGDVGDRFAKLWAAVTSSALGTGLVTVGAPLLATTYSTDPFVISAAFAVAWLPWLVFALPGGVLIDRVDRRRLMIVLSVVRVAALLALGLAIAAGAGGIAVLYVVLFVMNSCEVVTRSASQAMTPAVAEGLSLERANGWMLSSASLMNGVVAAPVAALLFTLAADLPFFIAAGAFALSAALLTVISGGYRAPQSDRTGGGVLRWVGHDAGEAFRWVMRQRMLRTMALLIGLLNLTFTAALALLVLVARQRLALGELGYAGLITCMAVGGILGAAVGDRVIAWATPTWTIRIGLLTEATMHLALAWSTSAVLIGLVLLVFGVHSSLWNIVVVSLRQRLTPTGMLGRVGSTTTFIAAGGNCVGALLGGVIASTLGISAPYWIGFGLASVVAAATWRIFSRAAVAEAWQASPLSAQ